MEWTETLDERLWLRPDETGENAAQFIIRALGLKPGMRVLDAPCGAGRIAVHVAKAGCRVTGIDRNPGFIDRAKARLAADGAAGTFYPMDLRQLTFDCDFDAVYCWGSSFGYFSDAENFQALRCLAAAMRPGGRLLLDQLNREPVLRDFRPILHFDGKTTQTVWEDQRLKSTWFIGEETAPAGVSAIRLYTPAQIRRLFARTGLEWETVYGGPDGAPYRRGAMRLIAVGRKAASMPIGRRTYAALRT